MDVLAFHWLRSGDVERGCDMLQNAAIKALEMGAYKECVNSLSQAIAYGTKWIKVVSLIGLPCWDMLDTPILICGLRIKSCSKRAKFWMTNRLIRKKNRGID